MRYKKILSIGSLIKSQGGQLTTGLSNVIWNLSYFLSMKNDLDVSLLATDFYQESKKNGNLKIYGWTKKIMFFYILSNPLSTIWFLILSIYLLIVFRLKFIRTFLYLLIFDRALKVINPDILHIHGTNYIYLHFFSRNRKKPIFITIHGINGNDSNIKNSLYQRKIEKIITKANFKQIIFISTHLRNEWVHLYGETKSLSTVILNAYDDSIFKLGVKTEIKKSNKTRLITVARVYPLKGQERVINALAQIEEKKLFEYHVIGAGKNDYLKKLKTLATNSDIDVFFHGEMNSSEIAKHLSISDYMILPSSSEGFGIVFLESIACGTKIIIPENLPISKETNLLSNKNAVFITDSTVESIKMGLKAILSEKKYSRSEVAKSLPKLNWNTIADKYQALINDF